MLQVINEVDVLIVGASQLAVEAALHVQRRGKRAMVVSDLSYLGEDSAGTLTCAPEFPLALKRRLEMQLLSANIPLLYLVRPVSILRDQDRRIAAVVLASRTSLLTVRCCAVVDLTRFGTVFHLAGAKAVTRPNVPSTVRWNVIAKAPPVGPDITAKALPVGFGDHLLYELTLPRASNPLTREHHARAGLLDANVLITADLLQDSSDVHFEPVNDVYSSADQVEYRAIKPAVGVKSDYRFADCFIRKPIGAIDSNIADLPLLGRFDVVVAGGGTGGAPAGIGAARAGAKTLLLEIQHGLGGVGTLGLISSYWFGNKVGFTKELNDSIINIDEETRANQATRWKPEVKSNLYNHMLLQAGGQAWLGSFAFGVRMDGNRVSAVLVSTPLGAGIIETNCVVDATGNADIAAAAGAKCRVMGADHLAVQGTGLSPRAKPDTRGQNSDHTFVDETDPQGITHAFANARAKFPDLFDNSPMVNSRERRQIHGEIEVSPLDILAERTFPDTVFTAASNFDTHGFIIHPVFMLSTPHHKSLQAHVPFRCMLPKGVESVLVTGLGMSAHRDALPVIRMQADVQNQGFAAGTAAAMAGKGRLRDLDIRKLQKRLVEVGNLAEDVPSHVDSFPVSADTIKEAAADLSVAMNVALLFAHPELSVPLLQNDPRLEAAIILGLMGQPAAAKTLIDAIAQATWDKGWNYTGMGQFGASMSRLDVLIIALARTKDPAGADVIREKINQLEADAEFSHCRAVSLAAALLPGLGKALSGLLQKPTITGHAQVDSLTEVLRANHETNETAARNLSLRELYLARGLYLAGDVEGMGKKILEVYASDLRGHYARHARAVLEGQSAHELA